MHAWPESEHDNAPRMPDLNGWFWLLFQCGLSASRKSRQFERDATSSAKGSDPSYESFCQMTTLARSADGLTRDQQQSAALSNAAVLGKHRGYPALSGTDPTKPRENRTHQMSLADFDTQRVVLDLTSSNITPAAPFFIGHAPIC